MAIRGARKLILTSRTGLRTGYQSLRIRIWRSYGVNVQISTADVTTEQGVTDLLKQANKLGPVSAIFNLAVVSYVKSVNLFIYILKDNLLQRSC